MKPVRVEVNDKMQELVMVVSQKPTIRFYDQKAMLGNRRMCDDPSNAPAKDKGDCGCKRMTHHGSN